MSEQQQKRLHLQSMTAILAGLLVMLILCISVVTLVLSQRNDLHKERLACIQKGGQVTAKTYEKDEKCTLP